MNDIGVLCRLRKWSHCVFGSCCLNDIKSIRSSSRSFFPHLLFFCFVLFSTFCKSIRSDAKKMQIIIRCEWTLLLTRTRLWPWTKTYPDFSTFEIISFVILLLLCVSIAFKPKSNTEMQFRRTNERACPASEQNQQYQPTFMIYTETEVYRIVHSNPSKIYKINMWKECGEKKTKYK